MSDKELLPHNCPKLFNDFAMCPTCDFQQTRPSPELSEKVHSCNQGVIDGLEKELAAKDAEIARLKERIEEGDGRCCDCTRLYEAEVTALQSRVDALEGWIRLYGRHQSDCPEESRSPAYCACGWMDVPCFRPGCDKPECKEALARPTTTEGKG
jgi:transcription elongation factor Elf1